MLSLFKSIVDKMHSKIIYDKMVNVKNSYTIQIVYIGGFFVA